MCTLRDVHIYEEPAVERRHETEPRVVDVVTARHGGHRPLEDPDNPAFSAIALPVFNPHHHPIAVHRLVQVDARHVDITGDPRRRALWHDEPKAAGIHVNSPHHQVHLVGKAVPVPSRPDEGAGRHQGRDPALERLVLLSQHAERLEQLPDGNGVIDLVSDAFQYLFVG